MAKQMYVTITDKDTIRRYADGSTRLSGQNKIFLAGCHFLMEEDMAEIKFASREHENFYKTMIQKSGNSDSYHRAFFSVLEKSFRRNYKR